MPQRPSSLRSRAPLNRVDAHAPLLASIAAGKIEFHAHGRGHYPGRRLAPSQLPGLLSLGYWDARGDQDWGMDFHRNEGVEICLLETGSMRFAVDWKSQQLRPGDLTITRPWQAHRQGDPHIAAGRLHWATIGVQALHPDQRWRWPAWVILDAADRAELTRWLRLTDSPVWRATPDIVRSFQRLALAGETATRSFSHMVVGLNELLLGVLEMLRAANRTERPQLASSEHSVEIFLADLRHSVRRLQRDWTLGEMAAACGVGTTQFSRLCRRLTNDSPARFLNLARIEAAARLLCSGSKQSVTDIAFECGFRSSQYFAIQFRRHFDQTPTEYRKRGNGR